jgi:serine/alanine adding enzyme
VHVADFPPGSGAVSRGGLNAGAPAGLPVGSAPDGEAAAPRVHVDECTESASTEWDRFVDAHPGATGYHQWAWRRVFERAFSHRSHYLAARRGGELIGILPLVVLDTWLFGRFAVSLPFVNYGGVVASEEPVLRALVDRAAALARERRWRHVEIRHMERRCPELEVKQHKVGMYKALPPDETTLWDGLDRKVRNQVRKPQKSGFTHVVGGVELLPDFYRVFAENMHDLGTPVYSSELFQEVLETFPDAARLHVVRDGPKAIAASLTFTWRRMVEVPWASSLKEYRSQNPNMLLYWEMLRHAVADGRTTFDFGRSTPDEGTFHFKRQWGAEPRPMSWEYWLPEGEKLPDRSPDNPKFKRAIALWQRLPLRIANFLGPSIVRGIP